MNATLPAPPTPAAPAPPRVRLALHYAVAGDLRFLSHHDELRLLSRALVRARWPLAFSQGFNPLPQATIAQPRPVGLASECQLALVELVPGSPIPSGDALAAVLPADCRLRCVRGVTDRLAYHAEIATYELPLTAAQVAALPPAAAALLARPSILITRPGGPGKRARPIELRPFIEDIAFEGVVLRLRLRITQTGSARPVEVLQELEPNLKEQSHRVRLVTIAWDREPAGPVYWTAASQEGHTLG